MNLRRLSQLRVAMEQPSKILAVRFLRDQGWSIQEARRSIEIEALDRGKYEWIDRRARCIVDLAVKRMKEGS